MLAGHVVAWPAGPGAARETDDLEGGVCLRVERLPLEGLETAAEHV
jgi:hypothetical protein